jgi:hypothetical protein
MRQPLHEPTHENHSEGKETRRTVLTSQKRRLHHEAAREIALLAQSVGIDRDVGREDLFIGTGGAQRAFPAGRAGIVADQPAKLTSKGTPHHGAGPGRLDMCGPLEAQEKLEVHERELLQHGAPPHHTLMRLALSGLELTDQVKTARRFFPSFAWLSGKGKILSWFKQNIL